MGKHVKQISLLVVWVVLIGIHAGAQTSAAQNDCSENAKQLVKRAYAAQPLDVRGTYANSGKAVSLYKEAPKDSPQCGSAFVLLVELLSRKHDYKQANEYNERHLKLAPNDPQALEQKASLVSALHKDYQQALDIRMKLLNVEGLNNRGMVDYKIAATYSLMNKRDEALNYLKLAISLNIGLADKENIEADSDFKNLRKDPRFWALVNQK